MDIPNGVTMSIDGSLVKAKGPKGEVSKEFSKMAKITINDGKIEIIADKALKGTIQAIINNMFKGVSEGHVKKLKALYAHFPVSIEIKGKDIAIKNFLGEREPRRTKVVGNTKVEVKGQNITVSGPDREAVGQTAANLVEIAKIRNKDVRVFQDGIYYGE